jgi:peptidoglycan L-alanyl-D-glutamate endopeptidase CwlK
MEASALDPHNLLEYVHVDLALVIRNASQVPQPFQVVYGLRTPASEAEAMKTGHSETMHSRHLACAAYGGCAMAVDIACLDPEGNITWNVADATGGAYGLAAKQILMSAHSLGVAVQWGGAEVGAWRDGQPSNFRDWGHFQLDWSKYP